MQEAAASFSLAQDRNVNNAGGGPEASRKTAAARRKLGTLGTLIEKLLKSVDAQDAQSSLTEPERNRRRDLLYDLRNRREQMQAAIRRTPAQSEREMLLGGQQQGSGTASKETEATAELDTGGLLVLQKEMMRNQDNVLEQMEVTVRSTKHIALAIGEEADLQTRLLDDLDDQVDVTNSRMKAATLRVKQIMKDKSHWKFGLCIFLLIIALVFVVVVGFKIAKLFG